MLHDEGLDRIAVGRRLLQGGHIPDAGEGHVQGTGDGGCGEGQHVHALTQLLQPLLVGDAEALLLVDDEQAQILVFHGLLQQLMGADDEVHRAGAELVEGGLLLGRGPEAAENVDVHGEATEPGHGGLIVLLGQDRGGD